MPVSRFACILVLLLSAATLLASRGDELVHAQLLADTSAIQPGKPFRLGVLLKIDPGWHIYWKNPGDSGLPTRIKLDLPPGFTAGDVQYPIPQKLNLPGDIVNYAYEDEVMLLVPVTPPRDLSVAQPVKLSANVKWLVCAEVCLPGTGESSVTLPVSATSSPVNQKDFDHWSGLVPASVDPVSGSGVGQTTSLVEEKGHATVKAIVAVSWWSSLPKDIDWFPGPHPDFQITDVQTSQSTLGRPKVASAHASVDDMLTSPVQKFPALQIKFTARWFEPMTGAQSLDSIVVYTDSTGQRRGLEVPITLVSTEQSKSSERSSQ
jgi:hypothetical protein